MSTKDILDEEVRGLNKSLKRSFSQESQVEEMSNLLKNAIIKVISDQKENGILKKSDQPEKVEISNTEELRTVIPETQKVTGSVKILEEVSARILDTVKATIENIPAIGRILDIVHVKVDFPEVQKIKGRVSADVEFPDVQKVSGKVAATVNFPEIQKVQIDKKVLVDTQLPVFKGEKLDVIPVMIWNGQRFIDPSATTSVQGNGKLVHAVEQLTSAVRTQSLIYTGQVIITTSGQMLALSSSKDIKTVSVQALKDNRGTIYLSPDGTNGYELQPGQPITVVVDNLSKVKINGSYINDGVCYLAS